MATSQTLGNADATPAPRKGYGKVFYVGGALAAAAVALLAIVGVGGYALFGGNSGNDGDGVAAQVGTLSATLGSVARAANDSETGVEVRAPGATEFTRLAVGQTVEPGSAVRTDSRTRARIDLSDGSVLAVNHGSLLELHPTTARALTLRTGELVAEVAHLEEGPRAIYETPTGTVEVLGTKFLLSATEDVSSVRVTRGRVQVESTNGSGTGIVKAGQEGLMPKAGAVSVSPTMNMAHALSWSEFGTHEVGAEEPVRGVGELRAKAPGEREDQERPLTLAYHKSTVRIVGNVARTEIEETFQNDSDQTLEGIYRFPLPPDARIASLQLEVDGVWEEGAFVERNRAQKIWRGVIRNATPQRQRDRREEFIWVPGPWRDPALLEWQQGGRFELRIFPIPAQGARKIRIAYTQNIAPFGARTRRYAMPLAHSGDESTRIGRFEVDMRIAGNEGDVKTHGYEMARENEGTNNSATRLRYAADNFLPSGDLLIDFELPNPDAEVRWWTFQGDATVAPPENSRERNDAVNEAQRALDADERGYVVFALRPELPAWSDNRTRDYVFVVDSSQSMVGERYERAQNLVAGIVSEMDRRDRLMVLACDVTCQTMSDTPMTPSSQTARQLQAWLGTVEPAGASDLIGAFRAAKEAMDGKREADRDIRLVYVGDGIPSVGHRRSAALSSALTDLVGDDSQLTVTTVGIGGDSDARNLGAIARAGHGHYVPYVPGQRVSAAAMAVLETTYGVSLDNATVELPAGVSSVAPAVLPTIRAGEEVLVVGRLDGTELGTELKLSGKVGGQAFDQRYPVTLDVSTSQGNAFVPRQWAAATIQDLELRGRGEDEAQIVALSKGFGVMSRHTSLLVLESEAMFRAFGVDRGQPTVQWTGDEDMEMGETTGLEDFGGTAGGLADGADLDGLLSGAIGGAGRAARNESRRSRRPARPATGTSANQAQGFAAPAADPVPAEEPMAEAEQMIAERQRGPGQWMRREWFRVGRIVTDSSVQTRDARIVAEAEAALRAQPDSRDRHRALARALARTGDLERALSTIESWMERDRMDAEALTYKADVLGRLGRQAEAMRTLSGIVDLDPEDRTLQDRLAKAFDRGGLVERACGHRLALADIHAQNLSTGGQVRGVSRRTRTNAHDAAGAALRCVRSLGNADAAASILDALPNDEARQAAEQAAARLARPERVRGEIMLDATWTGGQDVDLSLVSRDGSRISWMGGHRRVVGEHGLRVGEERLGLRGAVGSYYIEVNRTNPADRTPVRGQIRVRAVDSTRTIPFTLTDDRLVVGRVDVTRQSRLVPTLGPR
ncbi:MAG: VIT domain-containing protein [Myxococcota bacterium]